MSPGSRPTTDVNGRSGGGPRFARWIRAAVTAYVLCTVLVVALHQHHDATRGHDCALCTVAHTPALVPHVAAQPAVDPDYAAAPQLYAEAAPDVAPRRAASSRAPPRR